MFSAKMRTITGSVNRADCTVDYFDDRRDIWVLLNTQVYEDVNLSTPQLVQTFVDDVVTVHLHTFKTAEEAVSLKALLGRTLATI